MQRRSQSVRKLPGVFAGLAWILVGCSREDWYTQQVGWSYVYEVGSARKITEWTLARTEIRKVVHGLLTLESLTTLRPREANDAIDGYLRVHQKILDGWPGLKDEGRAAEIGSTEPIPLVEFSRDLARSGARQHPDNPKKQELWRRLRAMDPGAAERSPREDRP
jgi:hypothetical protein